MDQYWINEADVQRKIAHIHFACKGLRQSISKGNVLYPCSCCFPVSQRLPVQRHIARLSRLLIFITWIRRRPVVYFVRLVTTNQTWSRHPVQSTHAEIKEKIQIKVFISNGIP